MSAAAACDPAAATDVVQQPAAVAAAPAMLQPTLPPPAAPLPTVLTRFLARESVQLRYTETEAAYGQACDDLQTARADFAKLQSVCKQNTPALHLPRSMQLKLVQRARFTAVAGQPDLYSRFTAALEAVDREASERTANILLEAKSALVAYLASQANARSFTDRYVQQYTQFISAYATEYNAQLGSAPSDSANASAGSASASADSAASAPSNAFPAKEAIAHFTQHLEAATSEHAMLSVERAQQRLALQAQRAAAEHTAQESVIAGATTGATLSMLVDKKLAPVQKQLSSVQKQLSSEHSNHQQQQKQKAVAQPHSNNAVATCHVTFDGEKKRTSNRHAGNKRPHSDVRGSGRDYERSSASARDNAGHTANNRRDSSAPSKNAQGGDRSHSRQANNRASKRGRGGKQSHDRRRQ